MANLVGGTRFRPIVRLVAVVAFGAALLGACSSSDDDKAKKVDDTSATTAASGEDSTTTTVSSGTVADSWRRDAQEHRGQNGKTFTYDCAKGGTDDTVWGVGTYTDDSSVCTAAVQVGLITLKDGGEVTIEIAEGRDTYEGGTANGITSLPYASWPGSFTFPDAEPLTLDTTGVTWSDSAKSLGLAIGDSKTVKCPTGGTIGSVWGTGNYTADSSICTAAVHSGLITLAAGGEVAIEVVGGLDAYTGSTANGVTTSEYGAYDLSFRFSGDQP